MNIWPDHGESQEKRMDREMEAGYLYIYIHIYIYWVYRGLDGSGLIGNYDSVSFLFRAQDI